MTNDQIITSLIEIESRGDLNAIGDRSLKYPAYGILQIRQPLVEDVNRVNGTAYKAEDCLGNRELSVWMFERYMDIYAIEKRLGRPVTPTDKARIWQGGPSGWKKNATLSYAARFNRINKEHGYA